MKDLQHTAITTKALEKPKKNNEELTSPDY